MPFSTIAVKLRLVMSKTNKKDKIGDQQVCSPTSFF